MIITKVKVREWFIFTEQKSLSGLDLGSFYLNSPKTLNFKWGGRWGSNPRQIESQSTALPTELRPPYIQFL